MSDKRDPKATRQKILEATSRIISDGGYLTRFTLETVAEEAGVSKGGLLHHFPSKEALLRGLVKYIVNQFEVRLATELEREEPELRSGRWTRAYIRASLGGESEGLFDYSPALLAFMQADDISEGFIETRFDYWQKQTETDGLDVVLATIIRLAVDGLFYTEIIDSAKVSPSLRARLMERLIQMTEIND